MHKKPEKSKKSEKYLSLVTPHKPSTDTVFSLSCFDEVQIITKIQDNIFLSNFFEFLVLVEHFLATVRSQKVTE